MLARREEFAMADENPRLESRVARIESDVAHINSSVSNIHLDLRELRKDVGGRIDALDKKGTSHFLWLLSTMIACLLALVGALLKGLIAH